MGLYLRKSVRVGPFRFNLSGSGIGVSCGIPGLRIGTGPRGNYISAGAGGIYYRSAIPGNRGTRQLSPPAPAAPQLLEQQPYDPTLGAFQTIDAGVSVDLQDVSSKTLIDELNEKRERWRATPWVVIAVIATCVLLYVSEFSPLEIAIAAVVLLPTILLATLRDAVRKTAVLLYDLDSSALLSYAELTAAFDRAGSSQRIWHVRSAASVLDRKYHAGASAVIDTHQARFQKVSPPRVRTNIEPLAIALPQRTIYLLPDRALLLDAAGFGALNYQDLQLNVERSTFVTGESTAPADAKIVEYTWRYVNKQGGPDHRFANNPQLPVIETRDVSFRSRSGLNATLKFSNAVAAEALCDALASFTAKQNTNITHPQRETERATGRDGDTANARSSNHGLGIYLVFGLIAVVFAALLVHHRSTASRQELETKNPTITPASPMSAASPALTQPTVVVTPPPTNFATATAKPTQRIAADEKFVTLTHPAAIITPNGRYTLPKGTRLPVTRLTRESVIVRYYDGHDYEIPRSATDRH